MRKYSAFVGGQLAENDRIELLKWLNRAKTESGEWPDQWKLEVVGYADASGSAVQNEALSKLRAEHAKTVALATGMDPNRIVCEGKGSLGSVGTSKFDRSETPNAPSNSTTKPPRPFNFNNETPCPLL